MDLVDTLRKQNVFIPAGTAKLGDTDHQVTINAMPSRVAELDDFPLRTSPGGAQVYLGDVASAQDTSQIQTNIVRIDGRRQVYIPIYRQPGANTIAIVDSIKSQLEAMLARLRDMNPKAKDLALEVVLDQSTYVREAIDGLTEAHAGTRAPGRTTRACRGCRRRTRPEHSDLLARGFWGP